MPPAFKPFFHHFRTAFPDMRITDRGRPGGWRQDCGALLGHGTPYRTWRNGGADRQGGSFTGMCIARIKDGKIAEGWNNFDFLSMYQQLGMQLS